LAISLLVGRGVSFACRTISFFFSMGNAISKYYQRIPKKSTQNYEIVQ
jgi:hypothetical protein